MHTSSFSYYIVVIAIIVVSLNLIMMMRTVKETFTNNVDNTTYNVVIGQTTEPILSLDTSVCSNACCEPGKGSGMSCSSGCICKNAKNDYMLSSRGGNRTKMHDEI